MIRFVTGTDTGVGKTVVSAVLARDARERGERVRYCKPVQTGVGPGEPGDAGFVRGAAGVEAFELERLPDPLAPAVAAERAGVTLDLDDLVSRTRALEDGLLLVEGAGGLLVPLCGDATMADLAALLGASLVVVARPGLGTLNHIALTLEAAATRGLTVEQVILSGWPSEPGLAERTNRERLAGLPLGLLPAAPGIDVDAGTAAGLPRVL